MIRHGMRAMACAMAIILTGPASAGDFAAGFAQRRLTDPVEGGPMAAVVTYPSYQAGGPTQLGPFLVEAQPGVTPAPGRFPLILVSHGTGGSAMGHHDTVTALARAGFIAAAVEHPRDNYRDDSGFGTDLQWAGRSHHMVALLDALLADATFGPLIDPKRIGIAGHSAGGYTGLTIVGGKPNFTLMAAYRQAEPNDPLMRRAAAVAEPRRKPGLEPVADPRVRAAFLMAPALGHLFDHEALAAVNVPLRIYRAEADDVLPNPWHAQRVREMLPTPPEYVVLPGAGHYVFLAPCTAAFAALAPPLCTDPPRVDRQAIHARMNAEMVDFFRRSLDGAR